MGLMDLLKGGAGLKRQGGRRRRTGRKRSDRKRRTGRRRTMRFFGGDGLAASRRENDM